VPRIQRQLISRGAEQAHSSRVLIREADGLMAKRLAFAAADRAGQPLKEAGEVMESPLLGQGRIDYAPVDFGASIHST